MVESLQLLIESMYQVYGNIPQKQTIQGEQLKILSSELLPFVEVICNMRKQFENLNDFRKKI